MVIGFDGSRAFISGRTGTENYSYQLLKALAEIDKKNKYLVYLHLHYSSRSEAWPSNFQFKVIPFPRLWTQIGLAIKTFTDPVDVLFVPAHTLPLMRRPGLKTVVTVHDLGSEYLPATHQLKQRLYLGLMQKFQLKTATSIIAVSEATKKDLIKRIGINQEKINVVYEGYDKKLFKSIKNDTVVNSLKHYNLEPGSYFLFVGTVQPRKNLARIIQAFSHVILNKVKNPSRMRDIREFETSSEILRCAQDDKMKLVIAGSKGWLSDEIYKLPKKLRIEDRIKFLGYVPDKDLPALYSGAVVLVFPSLFEGFGLPILEAQACGVPVLTSNISSMPEVAGFGGAVYVNPYDLDDIVKGMIKINNQETRNKLIKTGFENIKKFSWEKCARETLKVLEK